MVAIPPEIIEGEQPPPLDIATVLVLIALAAMLALCVVSRNW